VLVIHSGIPGTNVRNVQFYVPLTVHFGIILFNNQLDALFFNVFIYLTSLHVSSDSPVIDSRWCHWGFFFRGSPSTEPCALGSTQPLKMSTRDFSCGKGGRCLWLTTYHHCSAELQENQGP